MFDPNPPKPRPIDPRAQMAHQRGNDFINRARRIRRWITIGMWFVIACVAVGLAVALLKH